MIRSPKTAALVCALVSASLFGAEDFRAQARAAELSGNLAKAESLYTAALQSEKSADLYQRLGLVRHLQNKYAPAAAAFQQALQLDSRLWSSHLFLGIDDYRLNRFSDALPHLETAEKLNPNLAEIQFWLGATQIALHRPWDGLETLEAALAKEPKNADTLRLLAETYGQVGTNILNDIPAKFPNSAAAFAVEGQALEFEGSNQAALLAYLKAEAKDPHLPGVRESIVRLQSTQQK